MKLGVFFFFFFNYTIKLILGQQMVQNFILNIPNRETNKYRFNCNSDSGRISTIRDYVNQGHLRTFCFSYSLRVLRSTFLDLFYHHGSTIMACCSTAGHGIKYVSVETTEKARLSLMFLTLSKKNIQKHMRTWLLIR